MLSFFLSFPFLFFLTIQFPPFSVSLNSLDGPLFGIMHCKKLISCVCACACVFIDIQVIKGGIILKIIIDRV